MGNRFEEVTLENNHKASIEFARQAKRLGVSSFIFAPSCSVYGAAEGDARTETSPLNPLIACGHRQGTLDKKGQMDGLPVMPQMLRYCG